MCMKNCNTNRKAEQAKMEIGKEFYQSTHTMNFTRLKGNKLYIPNTLQKSVYNL